MRTSICKECIHIGGFGLKVIEDGVCNTTRRSPVCNCIDNAARNFVTGDFVNSFCEDVNRYGECRFFHWIHPDNPVISVLAKALASIGYTNYKDGDEIYYSLDGSDPTAENGLLYTGTFEVQVGVKIKAVVYRPSTKEYSDIEVVEVNDF